MLKVLFKSTVSLFKPDETIAAHRATLRALTQNRLGSVENQNPLVRYAQELWAQGVEQELFLVLLSEKRRELDLKQLDAVQALKNLSKYPPALGMVGTVIGMIGLFANLDQNRDMIGVNLSLALTTATFLGLIMANLVVSPMADRLQIHQAKVQQLHSHLYELILLINRDEAKSLIEEEMNGRAA